MFYVLVTHFCGDGLHGLVGFLQQSAGSLHPGLFYHFLKGCTCLVLDILGKIGLGKMEFLGQGIQGYVLIIILDVVDNFNNSVLTTLQNMLLQRLTRLFLTSIAVSEVLGFRWRIESAD